MDSFKLKLMITFGIQLKKKNNIIAYIIIKFGVYIKFYNKNMKEKRYYKK